jgi:hypothetical protein
MDTMKEMTPAAIRMGADAVSGAERETGVGATDPGQDDGDGVGAREIGAASAEGLVEA